MNGEQRERGRERRVIYAELEEMIERVDEGGREGWIERGRQATDKECNLCRALSSNKTPSLRVRPDCWTCWLVRP